MKKKKIIFIICFILLLVLLIPIPIRLKDGGTVEYKAILYEVSDVKKLNDSCTNGYEEGIIVKVFGFQIFNNTVCNIVVNVHYIADVSMKIKENTLTDTSMVVIIEDLNEDKYTYGEEFYIEKKDNDRWIKLKPINDDYGFNEMGYLVGKDNKLEMKQDWLNLYGKLDKGHYRLIKNVYEDNQKLFFSVEFKI